MMVQTFSAEARGSRNSPAATNLQFNATPSLARCAGASLEFPLEDAIDNMRVIDAIFRAAESGVFEQP